MRTALALAVGVAAGIAVGAGATYHLTKRSAPRPPFARSAVQPSPLGERPGRASPPEVLADAVGPGSTAARADLYRLAAEADAAELEMLVAAAAAEPSSARRDFEVATLLARYAELDAVRAVALARDFGLRPDLAAPLYAAWAERDPDAALASLRTIAVPTDAVPIAVAMQPALGRDGFERILAALGIDGRGRGTSLGPDAGAIVAGALAGAMARRDLASALAKLGEIHDPAILQTFRLNVLREWLRSDPEGAIDYVAGLQGPEQEGAAFALTRDLARADPRRALELANRLAPRARDNLQQIAIQTLAESDARAALRVVDSLPEGLQRQQIMLGTIAGAYGRQYPDEALAWARRLGDERGLLGSVMAGIARADPERAFALAVSAPQAEKFQAIQGAVMGGLTPGADPAVMAERVLGLADPELRAAGLSLLVGPWAQRAPRDALDWIARNADRLPEDAYRNAAQAIGENDPAAAARYVDQVPRAARADWIRAVAQGYARTDVDQGVAWIEQFRGEPGYSGAVDVLAQNLARSDPPRAARLLATMDRPRAESSNTVVSLVSTWAQRDPAAAAEWVLGFENRAARARAIPSLVSAWSATDLPAARDWTLRLPAGPERDAALTAALSMSVMRGQPADSAIRGAFSNGAALRGAVTNAAVQLAYTNPARAHEVAASYVADSAERARLDKAIDEIREGGAPDAVFQIEHGVSER